MAQLLLSLAIVYGLTFLIPTMDDTTAVYLSSGAIVLGIIAVGGVLSAQIVSTAKQNGIVSYQRTLPVSDSISYWLILLSGDSLLYQES